MAPGTPLFLLLLSLCVSLHPEPSAGSMCPFNDQCDCQGGSSPGRSFKYVKCTNMTSVQFEGPVGAYSVTGEMTITTARKGCTIPDGAFAPFASVTRLTFLIGAGSQHQIWRWKAFDGLRVQQFELASVDDEHGGGPKQPLLEWHDLFPYIHSIRALGELGLRSLEINGGRVRVPKDLFAGFDKLSSLVMENVRFDNLTRDTFGGGNLANTLTDLSLRSCGLTRFQPDVYEALGKLERLDLSRNPKMQITGTRVFSGLKNLRMLKISGRASNTKWDVNTTFLNLPPLLEEVTLDDGWLNPIPAPLNLPPVTRLYFTHNQLRVVGRSTDPVLFLKGNRLTLVDLSENAIASIYPGSLANLTSVKELGLRDTGLDFVDPSIFTGMNALTTLTMDETSYPKGVRVSNITLVPPNLSVVTVKRARISHVEPSLRQLVERPSGNFQLLDMTEAVVLNCTTDMAWMAKHALCAPRRILIELAYCGYREVKTLGEYLREIAPNPCP